MPIPWGSISSVQVKPFCRARLDEHAERDTQRSGLHHGALSCLPGQGWGNPICMGCPSVQMAVVFARHIGRDGGSVVDDTGGAQRDSSGPPTREPFPRPCAASSIQQDGDDRSWWLGPAPFGNRLRHRSGQERSLTPACNFRDG